MDTSMNMLSGGVLGYVFRQYAESQKRQHEVSMAIADKREKSMEKAATRGGTVVRRFLVGAVVFVIVSAVIAGWMGADVVLESEVKRKFFMLEWEKVKYVTVNGAVILKEIRPAFEQLIGFYFGQAVR